MQIPVFSEKFNLFSNICSGKTILTLLNQILLNKTHVIGYIKEYRFPLTKYRKYLNAYFKK